MIQCAYIFKILKVNVPVKFSGTEGFPLRRDGRYKSFVGLQVFTGAMLLAKCELGRGILSRA